MLPSVVPRLATDTTVRVFPGVWKPLFFKTPFLGWSSVPTSFVSLSFIFFPTSFQRQWAAFLGAWCLLPVFRSCFVEFAQRSNALLMNLWGRKWSPRPIPPPSSILGFWWMRFPCFYVMCPWNLGQVSWLLVWTPPPHTNLFVTFYGACIYIEKMEESITYPSIKLKLPIISSLWY